MDDKKSHTDKKPLRIILSGGGTRCAYQLALFEKLHDSEVFSCSYEIDKIYGTSFGSLVGFFICLDRYNELKQFFLNLDENSLKPWFDLWGYGATIRKIPLLGSFIGTVIDIIWLLVSLRKKSLFEPSYGVSFLDSVQLDESDMIKLERFYCCVYNVTKGDVQFIQGSHPFIKTYLIASSALWLIFPPVQIHQLKSECVCTDCCDCDKAADNLNNLCSCSTDSHRVNEFVDGGLSKHIPLFATDNTFQGETFIVCTNIVKKDNKLLSTGNHLLQYLDNIIGFLGDQYIYYDLQDQLKKINKGNIKMIEYSSSAKVTDVGKENITNFMMDGMNAANRILDEMAKN
jgi:predicted acylesterase/phospholipase RssA